MEADIEIQLSQVEPYNGIEEQGSEICEVCYLPVVKFVTLSECGHRFCETCVNTAFDSYLMGGRVTISCLQCSRPANPHEIKENLTPQLYDKYLEFSLRRYLILQKNVRHCTAPDCPFAYIVDNPSNCEDDHFVCLHEGCGTEYCIKCNRPWHEGISCNKAKSKRQKDKANVSIYKITSIYFIVIDILIITLWSVVVISDGRFDTKVLDTLIPVSEISGIE